MNTSSMKHLTIKQSIYLLVTVPQRYKRKDVAKSLQVDTFLLLNGIPSYILLSPVMWWCFIHSFKMCIFCNLWLCRDVRELLLRFLPRALYLNELYFPKIGSEPRCVNAHPESSLHASLRLFLSACPLCIDWLVLCCTLGAHKASADLCFVSQWWSEASALS